MTATGALQFLPLSIDLETTNALIVGLDGEPARLKRTYDRNALPAPSKSRRGSAALLNVFPPAVVREGAVTGCLQLRPPSVLKKTASAPITGGGPAGLMPGLMLLAAAMRLLRSVGLTAIVVSDC